MIRAAATLKIPHVIPYQGSKRLLAGRILDVLGTRTFATLYEPFAGSAALTMAAAQRGVAGRYVVSDSLEPLVAIWRAVLTEPMRLAAEYDDLWQAQVGDAEHFTRVRDEFNASGGAAQLLYLLARCVKNAPRFNASGAFNQSADKRRMGTRPAKMQRSIMDASSLLADHARAECGDAATVLQRATADDLVYLDPPWEGTTMGTDKRYHQGLDRERLITLLGDLNARGIPFLLSYDGQLGSKSYGDPLPDALDLLRIDLHAGRSAQATLAGRTDHTVEALYISPAAR